VAVILVQVKLMGLSTSTVRSITDDVLFIAKVESGEFNLIFTPIELRSVVSSTMKLLGHTAAAKRVLLSINVDSGIPAVLLGVGNRLQQVLTNITSNGKYPARFVSPLLPQRHPLPRLLQRSSSSPKSAAA
jgi:signal transduction histidine kinase